jgi:mannosyltransferase
VGRQRDLLAVGLGAVALLALVLPWYARRPYWFDELVSVEIASLSPRDLADYVLTIESNMGLYHVLLAPWLVVGDTEAWVRLLSVGFALGTLPYLYGLAARLFDRQVAVGSVALLAVNVSFVGHARDARGYALAVLLVTASAYHLVRALDQGGRRQWLLFALAAGLAVWAHVLAALVVMAQVAWLALQRPPWRVARGALATIGVLVVPLVLAIVLFGQEAQLDWLERAPLRQLPGVFEWFVQSRLTLVPYFIGGCAALLAAVSERRTDGTRDRYPLLLLWLVLPPLAAYALSFATPVYLYRYFLVCLPALVVLVAAGLLRLRPRWLGVGLLVAAVALSVRTTIGCQPDCKIRHDAWGAAARSVAARARPGDAIVLYPSELRTAFDHYLAPSRPALLYPERWGLLGARDGGSVEVAAKDADAYARVWLVTWWLPSGSARSALSSVATRVDDREFSGNVRVELYRPR